MPSTPPANPEQPQLKAVSWGPDSQHGDPPHRSLPGLSPGTNGAKGRVLSTVGPVSRHLIRRAGLINARSGASPGT